MSAASPPPGWYPDPGGAPALRYWDGRQWTAYTHPPAAPTSSAASSVASDTQKPTADTQARPASGTGSPTCPGCGEAGSGVPLVYGVPNQLLMPLFLDGRIAAGGAMHHLFDGSGADWQCRRCGVQWSGGMFSGTGDSVEDPVVIVGAGCTAVGIRAEKQYLTRRFGPPAELATDGRGWKLLSQALIGTPVRPLDALEVELATGGRTTVFFDVTDFFGKLP